MRRSWYLGVTLLALAGCAGGGDGDGPVDPPPTPTISIQVSPASATVDRGGSTTSTVTLTRGGNYTGTVSLAATAPSGVTVTFNPASLGSGSTASTATIAVGSAATAGGSVVITASGSGVASASGTFALAITPQAITITAGASALSVVQGGSGTIPLTITRTGGYSGAVTVAATGLPSGVTAAPVTIAAGSTTGTMTVAVGASAAATTSAVPITLTASGTGVSNQTATVNLSITSAATPAFSLTPSPASASISAGQSATSTITVTRSGGFAGAVALTVAGAPTGMTATLNPASVAAGATTSTLTLATTSAVTPGTYNLTVSGTGTGVANQTAGVSVTVTAAPGISITTSAPTVSGAAGGTATTGVTLTRAGGYTGDVSLAVSGLPTGATAAFAPAALSGSTAASTLTLTLSAAVAPGTYPLVITATGPITGGTTSASANLSLTVTAALSYTLAASATSLQQGGTGTSTVTITRGGGFSGAVTLAVSNLPTGVTASFNPAAPTGNTSTLTFTATAGAATGNFTATITGTATGLANVTTTVAGTVTASGGGGGGGSRSWTFCAADRFPVWFAVQNGGTGAWTTITPTGTTNRVYSFNVSDKAGVAFAIPGDNGSTEVTVNYLSAEQIGLGGMQECVNNQATKTLTGTVAGLVQTPPTLSQSATVWVGFGSGNANANGPITVQDARAGLSDLLAIRQSTSIDLTTFAFTVKPDKAILRRNVNYTSTIPALDFAGAEAFTPASAQITVGNLAGEQNVFATALFGTANGTSGSFVTTSLTGASTVPVYGIPTSMLQSGDQHQVMVVASSTPTAPVTATTTRIVTMFNQQLANRTITLGAAAPAVTPTLVGFAPYARFSVTGAWPADYPDAVGVGYTQNAANTNSWTLSVTRAFAGTGGSFTLAMPDFSGVSGFQNSWGLKTSDTNWALTATGIVGGLDLSTGQFAEGGMWRAASRTGTVIVPLIQSAPVRVPAGAR